MVTRKVRDGVMEEENLRSEWKFAKDGKEEISQVGRPVCAENGGLIEYRNYKSERVAMGKESRVKDDLLF